MEADQDLIARDFAAFYRRHLPMVVGWSMRQLRNAELAADLSGEVFAAALLARDRFDPGRGTARAWLLAIARHSLIDSVRRGRVEDRARRELGVARLEISDDDLARVEEMAAAAAAQPLLFLDGLPPEQRRAIEARVLDELDYADVAARLQCSEAVARKRVSRGLRTLRQRMETLR